MKNCVLFSASFQRARENARPGAGADCAPSVGMRGIGQRFVYILRSLSDPSKHYVGVTGDVENRLEWHNYGPSGQTLRHRPWTAIVSMEFADEQTALRFERYLKTGSGRAFAKRHFTSDTCGS